MRMTAKPVFFGTPLLIAAATFVLLWMMVGGGSGGNTGENALIDTNVAWKIFNSEGLMTSEGSGHNFTANNMVSEARNYLAGPIAGDGGGGTAAFTNIGLCATVQSGITADGGTQTAACLLNTNSDITNDNPRVAASITTTDNTYPFEYVLVETFAVVNNAITVKELVLSKNVSNDTAPGNSDIGAVQAVDITLQPSDTLQVTWTVTVN